MEEMDSAIVYYKRALNFMRYPYTIDIYNELASTYFEIGKANSAYMYLQKVLIEYKGKPMPPPYYLVAGEVYGLLNKTDSALFYLNKVIDAPTARLNTKGRAYFNLSQIHLKQKNYREYAYYQQLYIQARDSIDRQVHKETLLRVQSLYNYQKAEIEAQQAKQQTTSLKRYLWAIVVGVLLLALLTGCIYFYEKMKKLRRQNDELICRKKREWLLNAESIVIRLRTDENVTLSQEVYDELVEAVNKRHTNFLADIANSDKLTPEQIQTLYLVRINLRTKDISRLLHKQPNSISMRLKKLANIIFDEDLTDDWHSQLFTYLCNLE
ncbi:MAG: hypothetical protein LBM62_06340, partial [Mediterranea sp.]|jgi:tetratricopeptide (TPR) repeat protein|nr:hypothetical protein [Mediterranea sp.]